MLNKRIGLLALGVLSATQAMANDQADAKGFVEDSHLNVLARNAYISSDYKNGVDRKAEWGQGFLGTFTSGFSQGTVGVGVDAFGITHCVWAARVTSVALAVSISSRLAIAAKRPKTLPRPALR